MINSIFRLTLLFVYLKIITSSINNNNIYNNNFYSNNNNNIQYNMLILRNSYLRLKLSEDVAKIKYYYKKMYTKTLNLYYDLNKEYYSLSDADRALIETIISLSY